MTESPVSPAAAELRRARRVDFLPILRLLAEGDAPLPVPDRASLRRFRNLVNDLGSDLYLAWRDDRVVGLVHVTFARQFDRPPVADLRRLVAAGPTRPQDARQLLELAIERAEQRGCERLTCLCPDGEAAGWTTLLSELGFLPGPGCWQRAVDPTIAIRQAATPKRRRNRPKERPQP